MEKQNVKACGTVSKAERLIGGVIRSRVCSQAQNPLILKMNYIAWTREIEVLILFSQLFGICPIN